MSKNILILIFIFGLFLSSTGCGYHKIWYSFTPHFVNENESDTIYYSLFRPIYDEYLAYYNYDTPINGKPPRKNATFIFDVTIFSKLAKNLKNFYNVENVIVNIEEIDLLFSINKAIDTLITDPNPFRGRAKYLLQFGPFKVEGSLPKNIQISFDLILTNPKDSTSFERQHMTINAKRKGELFIVHLFSGV
ncbi:MAG: hypothetical protein GY865_12070 [candidate division Zixibacteria bacterium]|nr:hypothetical protein [candidate division Zixibacteria bacterium]